MQHYGLFFQTKIFLLSFDFVIYKKYFLGFTVLSQIHIHVKCNLTARYFFYNHESKTFFLKDENLILIKTRTPLNENVFPLTINIGCAGTRLHCFKKLQLF